MSTTEHLGRYPRDPTDADLNEWAKTCSILASESEVPSTEEVKLVAFLIKAGPAAIPHLRRHMPDPGGGRAIMVLARILSSYGKAAAETVPELLRGLDARDDRARQSIVQSIGRMSAGARFAVPALIRVLSRDRNHRVRVAAALALGEFGPRAQPAVEELASGVRLAASAAVDDQALTATDTVTLGVASALALCRIGADARVALPRIHQLLERRHPALNMWRRHIEEGVKVLEDPQARK